MRIISFNANGIRSAASKGFFDWFAGQHADLLCVQETKAQPEQLRDPIFAPSGYHAYFRSAQAKGYSGVAIYSKQQPDALIERLDWPELDDEGRYLEARFGNLSVVSLYLPSGSSGPLRQDFKFAMMQRFTPILAAWLSSGRDYVIAGDWNIVHDQRDIRNFSANQKTSGCLPEERAWLDQLINGQGWVDSYRALNPDGEDYTWWSQRGGARARNVGWRIDYQMVSPALGARLKQCAIAAEPKFSDHAPYWVDYR
ncbi:MAG: exodeoxyribonuclease III [Lysobacterales bacterium CG02_land_8_20_14_3_00_62_12]|nr:MAG: exodeoxyribonuclease III [Xanthomonadales bacterium CG02_land_8_20_14_3_00_62_12]